jgi:hypothetical protein
MVELEEKVDKSGKYLAFTMDRKYHGVEILKAEGCGGYQEHGGSHREYYTSPSKMASS